MLRLSPQRPPLLLLLLLLLLIALAATGVATTTGSTPLPGYGSNDNDNDNDNVNVNDNDNESTAPTSMECRRTEIDETGRTGIVCTGTVTIPDNVDGGVDEEERVFQHCFTDHTTRNCVTAKFSVESTTATTSSSPTKTRTTISSTAHSSMPKSSDVESEPETTTNTAIVSEPANEGTATTANASKPKPSAETTNSVPANEDAATRANNPKPKSSAETTNSLPANEGPATRANNPKPKTSAGPIVVGQASYQQPYRDQYGIAVGEVLEDYHILVNGDDILDGGMSRVEWYNDLGNAHMDDAEYGVHFEAGVEPSNHANHPKNYHMELALQAYEWAANNLNEIDREVKDFLEQHPASDGRSKENVEREKMIRLQYYANIEYNKGEAYWVAAGDSAHATILPPEDEVFEQGALKSYRKAHAAYEDLRYLYAKLSAVATQAETDDPSYIHYFNKERYYIIENFYAHSCFQLAMALYSELIRNQNAEVSKSNDKVMELVKSQMGLDVNANEEDIVAALMEEAAGGFSSARARGGGAGGGGAAASFVLNYDASLSGDDLSELLGGGIEELSEERKVRLVEIAGLLDTAILTYQQHAYPSKPAASEEEDSKTELPTRVIINGVPQKSVQEIQEEDRLFHWRSSLVLAYEHASIIATTRLQHIRSRELITKSLEIYMEDILPYYDAKDQRSRQRKSRTGRGAGEAPPPASMTSMTRQYAEVSVGHLYVSQADTALKLGHYRDSKESYERAMDWHVDHRVSPQADGLYYSLMGDEAAIRQYKDYAAGYVQELDQYQRDVKTGYVYRDDNYEAELYLTLAPVYMAVGDVWAAIDSYKNAIRVFERITGGTSSGTTSGTSNTDDLAVLNLGDARAGLATAYFHASKFEDSNTEYKKSCDIYLSFYGEGTPPAFDDDGSALEEMKDAIVETYGEEYYEQLKAQYESTDGGGVGSSSSSVGGGGGGVSVKAIVVGGSDGGNHHKNQGLATNFNVYHNETEDDTDGEIKDETDADSDDAEEGTDRWNSDEL